VDDTVQVQLVETSCHVEEGSKDLRVGHSLFAEGLPVLAWVTVEYIVLGQDSLLLHELLEEFAVRSFTSQVPRRVQGGLRLNVDSLVRDAPPVRNFDEVRMSNLAEAIDEFDGPPPLLLEESADVDGRDHNQDLRVEFRNVN